VFTKKKHRLVGYCQNRVISWITVTDCTVTIPFDPKRIGIGLPPLTLELFFFIFNGHWLITNRFFEQKLLNVR